MPQAKVERMLLYKLQKVRQRLLASNEVVWSPPFPVASLGVDASSVLLSRFRVSTVLTDNLLPESSRGRFV